MSAFTTRLLLTEDLPVWDQLVSATPESGIMQSSAWANFKRLEGYEIYPIGVFNNDQLVGGAMLHLYPGEATLLFAPEGPILPWQDESASAEVLRCVLSVASEIAKARNALTLRIEPHVVAPRPRVLKEFKRSPVDYYPSQTMLLDTTKGPRALLNNMHEKGRYNIRLSNKHGVRVETSQTLQDLHRFYTLIRETGERNDFYVEPYRHFINLASSLFLSDLARLYIATHEGEDLAAAIVTNFGTRSVYLYGASSTSKRNLMAPYALHWKIIRDAKRLGVKSYDLFGYEAYGFPDHMYAGFSRFKKQFNGEVFTTIGAQEYAFYDTLADVFAKALIGLTPTEEPVVKTPSKRAKPLTKITAEVGA